MIQTHIPAYKSNSQADTQQYWKFFFFFFTGQCQQRRDGLKDERQHRSSTTHCYLSLTDLAQRLVHRHHWELKVGDTHSLAQELCTWPSKQLQPTALKGLQLNKQRNCGMLGSLRAFSSDGVTSASAVMWGVCTGRWMQADQRCLTIMHKTPAFLLRACWACLCTPAHKRPLGQQWWKMLHWVFLKAALWNWSRK